MWCKSIAAAVVLSFALAASAHAQSALADRIQSGDRRAALEMILAVYESHRLRAPVDFPLKNRRHPLTMLG